MSSLEWVLGGNKLERIILISSMTLLFPVSIGQSPGYFYSTQSFDCSVYEGGDLLQVSQSSTLYCFEGSVDSVNITLPYSGRQTLGLENTLVIQSSDARSLERIIHREENLTVIQTTLAERLYPGEETTFIARYTLRDLSGVGGTTIGDRLFGRDDSNTVLRFNLPIFEAPVSELIVRIYPPVDQKPKDWWPQTDSAKTWRADGVLGIIWHLTSSDIPEQPGFEILFGGGGWNITPLDILGISLVALIIILIDRQRLHAM